MTQTQVDAIRFPAEIIKVQTMVDGAFRLTLDLPAGEIGAVAKLMEAKQRGAILEVTAFPVLQKVSGENAKISKGQERKSEWTPAQE